MKSSLLVVFFSAAAFAAHFDLPTVYSFSRAMRTETVPLPRLVHGGRYSLLLSTRPECFGDDARLPVILADGGRNVIEKTLHAGDSDLYATFGIETSGANASLRMEARGVSSCNYSLRINRLPESAELKRGGNHTWKDASSMTLGETVFASSDEMEYIPVPAVSRKRYTSDSRGEDWYRFHFDSPRAKLVFFQLELMDRDDLPVDVALFREKGGRLEEYLRGQDPVAVPHEVQALPGNKFSPRVLEDAGDYYVRVRANHPEYKLRTRIYNAPPYSDPREAVRAAVDYIMGAGDSWFANTPRRGGTLDRITPVHQETSLCVSCHPAHFSQRAQLYAAANGYPVAQRQQLQFLAERFYNNPRPFYGFENQGAVWARVISAPANVLSRMSQLTGLFEEQISRQPRLGYHEGIAKYLELYYSGRTELPPDETNGNTPLVSAFEVGWYSWKTTHDPRLPDMMARAEVKNMVDLCYQTLALADVDLQKYREIVARNAQRILSLQRADGQWSMRFEAEQPEVEFQTGHALWALSAARIPAENPQVAKAIDYLMKRQQTFGGWMDPLQSFENFRTPFRETQFAVLALSSYFPGPGRAKGWDSPRIEGLRGDPVRLLEDLDQIWDLPPASVVSQIEAAADSNEVLIRQGAVEALGRLGLEASIPQMVKLLGDPSKLVQRTAAWGLRQIYANHPDAEDREIGAALASRNSRERWGATRIFAHHFASLARRDELIDALARCATDPAVTVRMQAIRGLWQSWFWNADERARNRIEDTILRGLQLPQHPWIEANLHAAIYNLADENIRYLYNNWVTLLPKQEDRERAVQGRLAIESRLAGKFAAALNTGSDATRKRLLDALTNAKQRRADIYDPESDLSSAGPPVYNRIGNDIEQIEFFGDSGGAVARAIMPLLSSGDVELRDLARRAALMVRETPYALAEKLAGGRSADVVDLGRAIDAEGDAEVSKAFHIAPPKPVNTGVGTPVPVVKPVLDEAYFRANVEPIFLKKGEDGYACVNCHATHTLFNATWATAMNVVDTRDPENSLLLRKPTSTAESEGVAGAKTTAHGGGRRWEKGSPPYQTILQWIRNDQNTNRTPN